MQDAKKSFVVKAPANLTLEQAQNVLASVLKKVGHPGCYSGFNISFLNAVDPNPVIMNVEHGTLKLS